MPDLDRIERKLPPEWRAAYRLMKGSQPVEEVGSAILSAVAQQLRKSGGLPLLPEIAREVQRYDAGLLSGRSVADVIRRLEHKMDDRAGKLLAHAALSPFVMGSASALLGPADIRLAGAFLRKLVEHRFFSQTRCYLVGKTFRSLDEAVTYEATVFREIQPGLDQLARSLSRDPFALRIRAPRRRAAERKSTATLLSEPL